MHARFQTQPHMWTLACTIPEEVKLIVQPDDGVAPLISGIDGARKSIKIAIFRFDHSEIKRALERAVARGVSVHALIANTNHGPEKELRKLERDLLPAGIEVARTGGDFLRYHYKFLIVDHKALYVLTFNYTHLDIGGSRSFGIITTTSDLIREAARLFEADVKRQAYAPETENFIVSPANARQELRSFIEGAERELLIYDPEISDRRMIRLLRERSRAGVRIRIIGRISKRANKVTARDVLRMRFHTRTIIRDRRQAFIGSQSLREAELDHRRELGLILHERAVVRSLLKVFEGDWEMLAPTAEETRTTPAKRVTRAVVRDLPLEPLVERAVNRALRDIPDLQFSVDKFEHRLEDALRQAVEDAVSATVRLTVEGATLT